jgi:hypothetical protein
MLHVIGSVFKVVTACAVVIPVVDMFAEFAGKAVGLNSSATGDLIPPVGKVLANLDGTQKTIADIAIATQQFFQYAAELSANIGNAIGVNHLAGVPKLKVTDFTEHGGIIPKVLGNLFSFAPQVSDAVQEAVKPENLPIAAVGAGVSLIAASTFNEVPDGIHQTVVNVAQKTAKVGGDVMQSAQKSAQTEMGKLTKKITEERANLTPTNHAIA